LRGFVFTIDSFMALLLAVFALSALLVLSNSPRSAEGSLSRLYLLADDSLGALSSLEAGGETATDGSSVLVEIGRLCSQRQEREAGEIAGNVLEPLVPGQFGFSLECEGTDGVRTTVYSRERGETGMRASSARVVMGERSGVDIPTHCVCEECPLCGGTPPGATEGRPFGPVVVRLSVWV
jgi:hypothetical protein